MNIKYPVVAAAVLVATLAACDKPKKVEPTPTTSTQPSISTQAERKIESAGAALDDASITAKVKTALISAPDVKGLAIDVDTSQNVVSLNGNVATEALRKQAEDVARKVEGVKEVKNNLVVKPAT